MKQAAKQANWSMALALLALGLWTSSALCTTHYVAKDGTGQFSVIQDAIDAAAEGDTIRIGAGRYEDFVTHGEPIWGSIIANVTVSNLTIIGAAPDSTVIGPATLTLSVGGRSTTCVLVLPGVVGLSISGLRVENVYTGVTLWEGSELRHCLFRECDTGLVALVDAKGTVISDSRFEWDTPNNHLVGILTVVGGDVSGTRIERCVFRGNLGVGIALEGGANAVISSCSFEGVNLGVELRRSPDSVIEQSQFARTGSFAVGILQQSSTDVRECRFVEMGRRALSVSGSSAQVTRAHLGGSSFGTIDLLGGVDLVIRDSDILKGSGPAVRSIATDEWSTQIDLRHNFWGSTDSLEIASWIEDGMDEDCTGPADCVLDTVQFWPVLPRSVPTHKQSVGGLKGRY